MEAVAGATAEDAAFCMRPVALAGGVPGGGPATIAGIARSVAAIADLSDAAALPAANAAAAAVDFVAFVPGLDLVELEWCSSRFLI